ncbi:MAG: autotransporter outer membrane beta-barrel domain-containing protein, partial [Stenotrophomonas sp.]
GNGSAIAMDAVTVRRDLPDDLYEIKAGAQFELRKGLTGWGQFSRQQGSQGYRDVSVQAGLKFAW